MRAAAKFIRNSAALICHFDRTNGLTIFFSKEGCGTFGFRLVKRLNGLLHGIFFGNQLVDTLFDLQ